MNIFQTIGSNKPQRSTFDLGHEVKMSMRMGKLVPFFCQEVVPGDSFNLNAETFMRLAPMLSPVMHRVNVYTHFFFVPNRLIWNEWKDFITGGEDGNAAPVFPRIRKTGEQLEAGYWSQKSLLDYMGLPPVPDGEDADYKINALPFRAYQEIYNEYYRDQNLEDKIDYSKGSGEIEDLTEVGKLMTMRQRCWEKDYFTSALPWTQKGDEVRIPLGGVLGVHDSSHTHHVDIKATYAYDSGSQSVNDDKHDSPGFLGTSTSGRIIAGNDPLLTSTQVDLRAEGNSDGANYPKQPSVDLSEATNAPLNDMREAFAVQRWLEKMARGGSRYIEVIKSHFGVSSSDARLQRPEYLGGGQSPVVISEVLQNSQSTDDSPQGTMVGHGLSVQNSNGFKKFFEEHGFVIGIISVLPRTAYQQGVPKIWNKFDKFDYFWPAFSHLGEQPIRQDEIKVDWNNGNDDSYNKGVFGYQSRYAEYRYLPSRVAGDFRNNLSFWHMGRIFSNTPHLNASFVSSDPTKRIFAVTSENEDELWVQMYINLIAKRPMPFNADPGYIDHF